MKQVQSAIKNTLVDPLKAFMNDSRSIGLLLLACTVVSLLITNSPDGASWLQFWQTPFHAAEAAHLPHSLIHWINDGFMALFFFVAGMEIKSEMSGGELSSLKKSLLPIFAAVGGMLVPALIYMLFNRGTAYAAGWGIPTATDIAFSLGIASLLGRRVPASLKIFLTALAIIDDLGAIVVIALFYGGAIQWLWLLAVAVLTALLAVLFKKRPQLNTLHIIGGILLWYCMYNTGIHATVAGVLFAFLIPAEQLHHLQRKLHRSVYFILLPAFALANTAIVIPSNAGAALNSTLSWGIMLGLLAGKPIGIVLMCLALVKSGYAELPQGVNWKLLTGAGILAGIGFTMSVFIATLAFDNPAYQDIAKISVLLVSSISMLTGYVWLSITGRAHVMKNTL
jgi:NhaA family Na+:H+ antiporter